MAYETWGELNAQRDNAVLVLHALTGDSHVVGPAGPDQPTPGWWDGLIGPGAPVDTDRFFAVAANVLGGCRGTTGPSSMAPDGRPYGSRFPRITVRDQVAAEAALADVLGITRFAGVLGGSMGGMRALEWAVSYPDRVDRCDRDRHLRVLHRRPDRLERSATRGDPGRRQFPRRRLLRRPAAAGRDGRRPGDRPHHLPVGPGTGHPVRPDQQGDEDPLTRWAIRRAVLPGAPRAQAGPAVRPEFLPGADRGDELPRHRPRTGWGSTPRCIASDRH